MGKNQLKQLIKVVGVCLLLTAALYTPSLIAAAGNTAVSISVPAKVSPGQTFTADINVAPGGQVAGMQINLAYNATLLTLVQVQEGTLLTASGNSTFFQPGTQAAGAVTGIMGVIITPGQSVSAAGTFARVTFTAKAAGGSAALTLSNVIAGDVSGQSMPVSLTNTQVGVNRPPVIAAIGNKSVNEGQLLQFTVTATDADSDALTYSAVNLPAGATFDAATRTFRWTPSYAQAGTYSVTFQVTDGSSPVQQVITITVNQPFADWDVNSDSKVNVLDMTAVGQHWGETGTPGWIREDINHDGAVNVLDMTLIGQHWTG